MDILTKLDHKNVVKCFGHFPMPGDHGGDFGLIIMELCAGTLRNLIEPKTLRDYEVSRITKQILHAIAHNDQDIIHW